MGREVKRVALDFDWPINEIWPFYAHSTCVDDCDKCKKAAKARKMAFTDYGCPAFERYDPPAGDGYQLWENTSEGSPMSPVFDTPEGLAKWLDENQASTFGYITADYETWLNFINGPGRAPTAIMNSDGIFSGVEFQSKK